MKVSPEGRLRGILSLLLHIDRERGRDGGDREGWEDRHPEVTGLLRTWHPSLKMTSEQGGRAFHAR